MVVQATSPIDEIGMRPLIEDEQGRMHGTLTEAFVATDAIGTTSPQDFNAYNGTGLPEPDWGKHGMKSTLQKFLSSGANPSSLAFQELGLPRAGRIACVAHRVFQRVSDYNE